MDIAIIGAGIAGLTAAQKLKAKGHHPVILEKSRGVGGRLSTRRTREGLEFDHGAQFFTAHSTEFRNEITQGSWADHIASWQPLQAGKAHSGNWFVGTPQMKSPLVTLAGALDVRLNTTVKSIERHDERWLLCGEGESTPHTADIVIVAAPSVQTAALTLWSEQLQAQLANVSMQPCWAIMVAFDQPLGVDADLIRADEGAIGWAARNSSKPNRDQATENWVLHASPEWSKQNLELEPDEALEALWPHFQQSLGLECPKPRYSAAHRWRYARVEQPAGRAFLEDETGSVFAIGDWCLGPRVEFAFQSGFAVADRIQSLSEATMTE